MAYLANGIQERIQQAFFCNNLQINVKADHIVVENSPNETEEKIKRIIESAGFYPLMSKYKINNNFVFTVIPYKIPEFFNTFTFTFDDGEMTLPDSYKTRIKAHSHFFKTMFGGNFIESNKKTIFLGGITKNNFERMLNSTVNKPYDEKEFDLEELIEYGRQAVQLDMKKAIEEATLKIIDQLEYTKEHFDYALEIQNTALSQMDNYFRKYILSLGKIDAILEFLKTNGAKLHCLDLSGFDINDSPYAAIISKKNIAIKKFSFFFRNNLIKHPLQK